LVCANQSCVIKRSRLATKRRRFGYLKLRILSGNEGRVLNRDWTYRLYHTVNDNLRHVIASRMDLDKGRHTLLARCIVGLIASDFFIGGNDGFCQEQVCATYLGFRRSA
jgi:hypothetical protein